MLYVSIFVELVRGRPALAMWMAAATQALLWTFVPTLFYAAPPGDVPTVLAIGHEFRLGTYLGPPLAFWLAEVVYFLTAKSMFGVYVLSQACVVVTYWAVFELGRIAVGAQHAALAVLMMVGISAFTVPTPDFGPVILTMALWALVLLHYYRVVTVGGRKYAIALAVECGLLLLTAYAGLLLLFLLLVFTGINVQARTALRSTDPRIAAAVAAIVILPYVAWLVLSGDGILPMLSRLRTPESVVDNFGIWLRQMGLIVAAHAGLAVLVVLVAGWPWMREERSPIVVRFPVDAFTRQYIFFFALVPPLVGTVLGVLVGLSGPVGGVAPLVILSALAIIVAAGDTIEIAHQHMLIAAWFGLLLVPPLMAVIAVLALPWAAVDLSVNQPVAAVSQFFSESFQRRVGTPLPIVAGDQRTAALIALGAPSRPSLFLDAAPERSPWVTMNDIAAKGAIVVWPTTDTTGAPPPALKERFPDMVPEAVPRAFDRPVQGSLPLWRIGWALIRPKGDSGPTTGDRIDPKTP
jgi:Dolichyl-phosphate-mannose-protein mannosyltransferase